MQRFGPVTRPLSALITRQISFTRPLACKSPEIEWSAELDEPVDIEYIEPPADQVSPELLEMRRGKERFELRGTLREMEHLRGGLGGNAPMHLNIDSRLVHGFRWVKIEDLLPHELVRPVAANALKEYLENTLSDPRLAPSIPAIVACSRTNTIIDGHHRHQVNARYFCLQPC